MGMGCEEGLPLSSERWVWGGSSAPSPEICLVFDLKMVNLGVHDAINLKFFVKQKL